MLNVHLIIAILAEVLATNALKASEEFTRLWPSVAAVLGYCIAFYFLSLALRTVPVGIAYAIWSGVGIVLITLLAAYNFKQVPDLPAIIGMGLIIAGVVVIQLFSRATTNS